MKKMVETSKILHLELRCFNEHKTEYENVTITDLPKGKIKQILIENIQGRLENAKNDYESYFDGETIFNDSNDE